MKINCVRIHNFRSIADISVSLHDYTLIVGANNAGKSNFVDAVRCFYDNHKFDAERDMPKMGECLGNTEESYVQMDFSGVNSKKIGVWNGVVRQGILRVRKYLISQDENLSGCYCVVDEDGSVCDKVKLQKRLPESFGTITYIPSMSKPTEELRTTGPSALRDLIGDVFSGVLERDKEFVKLRKALEGFSKKIRNCKDSNGVSVNSMENRINERMKANWNAKFTIGLRLLSPQDILKGLVTVGIEDEFAGDGLELDQFGSGFQRSLICEIINAKAGGFTRTKMRKDNVHLLVFEEPEAFLHRDQQEELARSLKELSVDGWQVICTSHAQAFVSRKLDDVPGIVRLEKTEGVTIAYQMNEKQWVELGSPIEPYPDYLKKFIKRSSHELDLYRYRCWFDGARADVFFASQVLLVEGASESALIAKLADEGKLKLPIGTVVVDCLGKFNYFRFIRLMYVYGIRLVVVIDSDSLKKGASLDEQKAWNRFVEEEVEKCGGQARLEFIEGDLENYLSIKPVDKKCDDLKPYHLLGEYAAGRYDKDKMASFCEKIEKLLVAP